MSNTNPRIIIDASYIRGMSSNGAPFRIMREQDARIVLIDTLIFELCTTDDPNQWPASQNKLKAGVNAIEVWEHVPPMYKFELEQNRPYGDPLRRKTTLNWIKGIANNSLQRPDDREVEDFIRERESNKMLASLHALLGLQSIPKKLKIKIQESPRAQEVVQFCYNYINNPDHIRLVLKEILQNFNNDNNDTWIKLQNPDVIDDSWVMWHVCKSLLAVFCDCRHEDEQTFGKKFKNAKHDLDYLISLAFADGIASCETKGEMSYYRKWIYGDTKPRLASHDETNKIVRFVNDLKRGST